MPRRPRARRDCGIGCDLRGGRWLKNGEETVQDCIFCKIVRGEIPSRKVYEDDEIVGFHDIHPLAPVHFMLVPKRHIASLADATADDAGLLGRIMVLTGRLAR